MRLQAPSHEFVQHAKPPQFPRLVFCFIDELGLVEKDGLPRVGFRQSEIAKTPHDVRPERAHESPDLESLKDALAESIKIHRRQRSQIGKRYNVTWKTSEQAIQKIREIVNSIR